MPDIVDDVTDIRRRQRDLFGERWFPCQHDTRTEAQPPSASPLGAIPSPDQPYFDWGVIKESD